MIRNPYRRQQKQVALGVIGIGVVVLILALISIFAPGTLPTGLIFVALLVQIAAIFLSPRIHGFLGKKADTWEKNRAGVRDV